MGKKFTSVASLILSMSPGTTSQVVRNILTQTADNIDDVNSGYSWENKLGAGRVNAFESVSLVQNIPSPPSNTQSDISYVHPVITWSENPEADVIGYNVHVKYEFGDNPNPKFWTYSNYDYFVTETNFTDGNWYVGDGDMTYYYVQAVDIIDNFSMKITTVSFSGAIGKETSVGSTIVENYKFAEYPNPFNPTTRIDFSILNSVGDENFRPLQMVTLKVLDILGREVQTLVDAHKSQGRYEFTFNGSKLSSGVYIYRITSGEFSVSKKFVLLK